MQVTHRTIDSKNKNLSQTVKFTTSGHQYKRGIDDLTQPNSPQIYAQNEQFESRARRLPNFFKQKTAYGIMSGDWSSDVCSSD
eukprot:COSAG06_NODE_29825_length_550_cov_0.514412_1_plen_82_part_10